MARTITLILLLTVLSTQLWAGPFSLWQAEYDTDSVHTIGLWHFNLSEIYSEDTKTFVNDAVSGTVHRAQAKGNSFFGPGGSFGYAAHTAGGSDGSNCIHVDNGIEVFPHQSDPSLTVECRVKFNVIAGTQFIIDKQWGYSDTSGGYRLYISGETIHWNLGDGNNTIYISGNFSEGLQPDKWYHIAGTWNAGNDVSKLYVNGKLIAAGDFSGSSIVNNSYSVRFGQRCVSNYAGLSGSLDEIRISDIAYQFTDIPNVDSELFPTGNRFCFTFYSTTEDDSIYALQKGVSAIGPYYGNQDDDLARAQLYDTKFLYKVHPECMKGQSFLDADFVMPDDTTIINDVASIVEAVKDNDHIAFWDVVPEELRHWKSLEMHYLDIVTNTIRLHDPHNRPIYMYEPNHRDASALSKTLIYQDICAKGMYVEAVGFRYNRAWCRWSMEQELEAIAAVKPQANPWIVLWMAWDAEIGDKDKIEKWCRHDSYMGLLLGGKGIQIWSGWRNRSGFEEDFDKYFDGYLSVANDLNGPLNLGPVFLFGETIHEVNMQVISGPQTVTVEYQGTHVYPSVTYLSKHYEGKRYLFMVNSANQDVTASFTGLPHTKRLDLFNGGKNQTVNGAFSIKLAPLAVGGFVFNNTGDLNANNIVDAADLKILSTYWLAGDSIADIAPQTGDGLVNMLDFAVLADNYSSSANN